MAKLSARGRVMVHEVSREYDETYLQARTDARNVESYPDGTWLSLSGVREPLPDSIRLSLTTRERVTRRLMSDGTVLQKIDVWFRGGDPSRQYHSYGWKVKGKIKTGITPADWLSIYTSPGAVSGTPSPWTVR